MKLSRLIGTVADAGGYPLGEVQNVARHLREAKLLPSGGRGLAAADVEPEHALDLLIGLTIAETAADAPRKVAGFYRLVDEVSPNATGTFSEASAEKVLESVERSLGRATKWFAPSLLSTTMRTAFGNLIRAEVAENSISNFVQQSLPNRFRREIFLVVSWPLPQAIVKFRAPEFDDEDRTVLFGGSMKGRPADYLDLPREHRVAFQTRVIKSIADAFRADAVEAESGAA